MDSNKGKDNKNNQLSERNQKIAAILTIVITLSNKIEKLKEKLCGFSAVQFSPENIFDALDLTNKGYLDLYDIRSFLSNDNIRDRDILLLLDKNNDNHNSTAKMTYLGYLGFLKPFFNHELARDLLLRDTISKRENISQIQNKQKLHQMQETVLLLLNELFLLNCICIAEHQQLKTTLMDQYMLNSLEIAQILGLNQRVTPLKAIFQFIQINSTFDVEQAQIKFILSFLLTQQSNLNQQKYINMLFSPNRSNKYVQPKTESALHLKTSREIKQLHDNYTKTYLSRNDLLVNTNKLNFINYIHPNSFQNEPEKQRPNKHKADHKQKKGLYSEREQEMIAQEHQRLEVFDDKYLKKSIKRLKHSQPYPSIQQERQLDESIIQDSHIFKSHIPNSIMSSRNIQVSRNYPIDTPVLQQFMHQSNIKRNMGQYKGGNRSNQLNVLLEQSSNTNMSNSDAFEIVDHTTKQQSKHQKQPKLQHQQVNRSDNKSKFIRQKQQYKPIMQQVNYNISSLNKSNTGSIEDTSGILNQFFRGEFR